MLSATFPSPFTSPGKNSIHLFRLWNHSITSNQDTFHLTSRFLSAMAKKKKKNKTTHSFLNSAQNITLSNLPLVNDNHKDEQNHQTEYKATLFFFPIWSMRSSQCWSTHPVRPRRSLAFQTISRSLDLQEVKNFKASWSFPLESHGSRYNFHFNDELGGN